MRERDAGGQRSERNAQQTQCATKAVRDRTQGASTMRRRTQCAIKHNALSKAIRNKRKARANIMRGRMQCANAMRDKRKTQSNTMCNKRSAQFNAVSNLTLANNMRARNALDERRERNLQQTQVSTKAARDRTPSDTTQRSRTTCVYHTNAPTSE